MGGDGWEVESQETDGGPGASQSEGTRGELGSRLTRSVGKAGQSLINELYPCFNNSKLYAEDVQIADTLGFPNSPPPHRTSTSFNLWRGNVLWPPIKSADNQGRVTLNTNGTAQA